MPAAAGLVLAVPEVTWWLVGPLDTAPARSGLDYAFRPWPISPAEARAAGLAASVVAVVSLTALGRETIRRRMEARWWWVLVPLLAAGFLAGAGWRVMTAGVLGSNIGAGFVVMIGGPLIAILVMWALGYGIHLAWRRKVPDSPQGPPPVLLAWAEVVDVSRVSDHTVKMAENYLGDYWRVRPLTAREFGFRLVSVLEGQVSPPPPASLTPVDIAAAVLAVRRKQLGVGDWPGWAEWPGSSAWPGWAEWPGWNRTAASGRGQGAEDGAKP